MLSQNRVIRLAVENQPSAAPNLRSIRVERLDSPNVLRCQEQFQTLVDSVVDYAIFMLDRTGNVITWNLGAKRMKGYEAPEILGQHFSKFYLEADIVRGKPKYFLELAASVGRCEMEGYRVRKDGSTFWANVVLTAVHDAKDNLLGFVKITRDLTERRKDELAVRESEERFRALLAGIVDYGVFMLDPRGIVTSWNTGAERMMGYTAAQIVGKHFSCFFLPDDVEAGAPSCELEIAESFGNFTVECWHRRSDGSRFWADVTISSLRDTDGRLTGFAKVTRDLSERRESDEKIRKLSQDLAKLNESLTTANADLETFSRAMAHDLNAPVRHVLAYTDMLLRDFKETLPSEALDHVQHVKRSAMRMSDLVTDLLDWFTMVSHPLKMERVDLQPLVKSVVSEFAAEALNRDIEWRIGDLFEVQCDRGLALLIFQNLIGNALKFTRRRDRAVIEIGHVVTDTDRVIFVRDNGVGFDMQYAGRLFQAFQRLHAQSQFEGTGIGLAVVTRVVQKHGGRIWADATPDSGATFSFTLGERTVK